ncbi:hypothetical protein SETIT_9G048600v2 [Setaria italica]|uniref:Uncharacterized protein n=1 Tax=Setaria italica TaxID=4555 RepID=A0A368SDD5_SETIT|nr:hypothetical protein SETIT_9G048600v2 [Setaria italica]
MPRPAPARNPTLTLYPQQSQPKEGPGGARSQLRGGGASTGHVPTSSRSRLTERLSGGAPASARSARSLAILRRIFGWCLLLLSKNHVVVIKELQDSVSCFFLTLRGHGRWKLVET